MAKPPWRLTATDVTYLLWAELVLKQQGGKAQGPRNQTQKRTGWEEGVATRASRLTSRVTRLVLLLVPMLRVACFNLPTVVLNRARRGGACQRWLSPRLPAAPSPPGRYARYRPCRCFGACTAEVCFLDFGAACQHTQGSEWILFVTDRERRAWGGLSQSSVLVAGICINHRVETVRITETIC